MLLNPPSGCIPSNADVSGIGVRLAVYIQATTSFVVPVLIAYTGKLTRKEKESSTALPMENLALSASLALTAFLLIHSNMSVYHALIISLMAWVLEGPLMLTSCSPGVLRRAVFRTRRILPLHMLPSQFDRDVSFDAAFHTDYITMELSLSRITHGIFGLFLWTGIATFGGSLSPCTKLTSCVIFGSTIPVLSAALRWASLIFHLARAVDGILGILQIIFLRRLGWMVSSPQKVNQQLALSKLSAAFVVLVILVVNIEQMIAKSRPTLVSPGENNWGFGQVVPVCVLLAKGRDLYLVSRSWYQARWSKPLNNTDVELSERQSLQRQPEREYRSPFKMVPQQLKHRNIVGLNIYTFPL